MISRSSMSRTSLIASNISVSDVPSDESLLLSLSLFALSSVSSKLPSSDSGSSSISLLSSLSDPELLVISPLLSNFEILWKITIFFSSSQAVYQIWYQIQEKVVSIPLLLLVTKQEHIIEPIFYLQIVQLIFCILSKIIYGERVETFHLIYW